MTDRDLVLETVEHLDALATSQSIVLKKGVPELMLLSVELVTKDFFPFLGFTFEECSCKVLGHCRNVPEPLIASPETSICDNAKQLKAMTIATPIAVVWVCFDPPPYHWQSTLNPTLPSVQVTPQCFDCYSLRFFPDLALIFPRHSAAGRHPRLLQRVRHQAQQHQNHRVLPGAKDGGGLCRVLVASGGRCERTNS